MKSNDALLFEISDLLIKGMDNALSKAEFDYFQNLLKSSVTARRYYLDLLSTHVGVEDIQGMISCNERFCQGLDPAVWQELADSERNAPAIAPAKDLDLDSLQIPATSKQLNRASLLVAIVSLAALFVMIILASYSDPTQFVEVATVADSLNAKWSSGSPNPGKDLRLAVDHKPLTLEQGMVKIQFDNHAKMVIEAPAQFELVAGDQVKLNYGRTYTTVPREAIGFTITTFNSKIVDLGTEFGIEADKNGNTELHVVKGKTTLVSGTTEKVSQDVDGGNAKIVFGPQARAVSIDCQQHRFIREFDSQNHVIWRGEAINLADMVGRGNGFGSGMREVGIDPATGEAAPVQAMDRVASNTYVAVKSNPFVDGIFVPNGQDAQIVSSEGHIFKECPPTHSNFFIEASYSPRLQIPHFFIDSVLADQPCLLLHANLGITFDLDAIRSQVQNRTLKRFTTQIYISPIAPGTPNADFWVLVDGKIRFSSQHVTEIKTTQAVSIDLLEGDRFLTLVSTDGGDPETYAAADGSISKSINSDWCVFANPAIIAE